MNAKFLNKFFYIAIGLIFIGILSLLVSAKSVMLFTNRLICIIIVISGAFKLVMSDYNTLGQKEFYLDMAEGFVNVLVGVVCIYFVHTYVVSLIFGLLYVAVPILRLALATNKINQLIIDFFKYLMAIVLFLSSYSNPIFAKIYVSFILILLGLGLLAIKIIIQIKHNDKGLF